MKKPKPPPTAAFAQVDRVLAREFRACGRGKPVGKTLCQEWVSKKVSPECFLLR